MPNQRWTGAKIDEDTWDAINYLAAKMGRTPRSLIPEIIEAGIETMATTLKEKPLEIRLWLNLRAIKRQTRVQDMLHELGYLAQSQNSEPLMDQLQIYCDEMGVDITNLLDSIDMSRQPRSVDIKANGTSVQSCANWLSDFMRIGKHYRQCDIAERAKALGFSTYVLKEAKTQLKIESLKTSKRWVWIWPQSDGDTSSRTSTILTTNQNSVPDAIREVQAKIRAKLNGDHTD